MALTEQLILQLHPTDYRRLVEAAGQSGQSTGDLVRLAIHREVSVILAASGGQPVVREQTHTAPARCALTGQASWQPMHRRAADTEVAA